MVATLLRLLGRMRRAPSAQAAQAASDIAPVPAPAPDHLLQVARVEWHLGDWEALAAIPAAALQVHPDRAELALLVASALQQLDRREDARRCLDIARAAGCERRLAARILVADVHNSLGRACALGGDQAGAERHFRQAVGSAQPGLDSPLVAQARARNEGSRLAGVLAVRLAQDDATHPSLSGFPTP